MAVCFTLQRSMGEPDKIWISEGEVLRLQQRSLGLRDKTTHGPKSEAIPLTVVVDEDIDEDAILYLLQNLSLPQPDVVGLLGVHNVSRQCNALWHYSCDPYTFRTLWDRLAPSWKPCTAHDPPKYCWRPPGTRMAAKTMFYYANVAWVLEQDDPFRQAIQSVVWDSTEDALATAVEQLRDVRAERYFHMRRVYEVMGRHVTELKESETTWKVGNKIQQSILEFPKLRIKLKFDGWEDNKDKFSKFSVYGFVHQVDLVLLRDTSDCVASSVPSSSNTPTLHADSDAASVSPKAPSLIQLGSIAGKIGEKITDVFSSMRGDQYAMEVRRMLAAVDARIRDDQRLFADKLIGQRQRILQDWRDRLRQTQNPVNVRENGTAT